MVSCGFTFDCSTTGALTDSVAGGGATESVGGFWGTDCTVLVETLGIEFIVV